MAGSLGRWRLTTNDSLLISLFRATREPLLRSAVLAVIRGRIFPEDRITVGLKNMHGPFELLHFLRRGGRIAPLRSAFVVSKFITVAAQPLDDRCHALLSDPIGPFEAPMTKESNLARREVGTIKDPAQRIPRHGGQLPMCRRLTDSGVVRAGCGPVRLRCSVGRHVVGCQCTPCDPRAWVCARRAAGSNRNTRPVWHFITVPQGNRRPQMMRD